MYLLVNGMSKSFPRAKIMLCYFHISCWICNWHLWQGCFCYTHLQCYCSVFIWSMVKLQDAEDNLTVYLVTKTFIWKHFYFFKQKWQASLSTDWQQQKNARLTQISPKMCVLFCNTQFHWIVLCNMALGEVLLHLLTMGPCSYHIVPIKWHRNWLSMNNM